MDPDFWSLLPTACIGRRPCNAIKWFLVCLFLNIDDRLINFDQLITFATWLWHGDQFCSMALTGWQHGFDLLLNLARLAEAVVWWGARRTVMFTAGCGLLCWGVAEALKLKWQLPYTWHELFQEDSARLHCDLLSPCCICQCKNQLLQACYNHLNFVMTSLQAFVCQICGTTCLVLSSWYWVLVTKYLVPSTL